MGRSKLLLTLLLGTGILTSCGRQAERPNSDAQSSDKVSVAKKPATPAATGPKLDDERATPKTEEPPAMSTEERLSLPGPGKLKSVMRSLAVLDVIVCEKPENRSFSFYPKWAGDAAMAKVLKTSGDDMFIFFKQDSAIIKGFDHESPISPYNAEEFKVWPGIYDGGPPHLLKLLDDEAVERKLVTFCIWNSENVSSNGVTG
jgi:hypothetical protein